MQSLSLIHIYYDILGLIVEKVSGVSYSEYLTATFFTPLGMKMCIRDRDGRLKEMTAVLKKYKLTHGLTPEKFRLILQELSLIHI